MCVRQLVLADYVHLLNSPRPALFIALHDAEAIKPWEGAAL